MATIFALSLVPAGAFAAEPNTGTANQGDLEASAGDSYGKLTIANTKLNETYDVYRIFDLASFTDTDPVTGHHAKDTEAYSYVINEKAIGIKSTGITTGSDNQWLTFLLNYGPNGEVDTSVVSNPANMGTAATDKTPYAVYSDAYDKLNDNQKAKVYFVIEKEKVTLNLHNPAHDTDDAATETVAVENYHVVRGVNAWDLSNVQQSADNHWNANNGSVMDDMSDPQTTRTDNDGDKKGLDYATITNRAVQDFAQEALKYARATATKIDPNYIETGASTSTSDVAVVVNGTASWNTGTDRDGTGVVPLGYYLVGTSMGTLAALDTTNDTVNVYEKNDEPTIEKSVMKKGQTIPTTTTPGAMTATGVMSTEQLYNYLTTGNTAMWVENTDADVNDYVQFRTVVTAQQGAKDYVLHDVMEQGLTFQGADKAAVPYDSDEYVDAAIKSGDNYDYSPKVFLVRDILGTGSAHTYKVWYVPAQGTAPSGKESSYGPNYVLRGANDTDRCDFEIEFKDATKESAGFDDRVQFLAVNVMNDDTGNRVNYLAASPTYENVDVKDGDKIVVLYWAKLNEEAAIWQGEETTAANSSTTDVAVNEPGAVPEGAKKLAEQKNYLANGNGRNDNYTVLTYGNKSYTKWDEAHVTTYPLDITKTKQAGADSVESDQYPLLNGATFRLYKTVTDSSKTAVTIVGTSDNAAGTVYYDSAAPLKFENVTDANDTHYKAIQADITGNDSATFGDVYDANYLARHDLYRFLGDDSAAAETAADLKPTNAKSLHLYGLNAGTYVLVETKAPTGYNKLAHPIVVTIAGDADDDGLLLGQTGYVSGTTADGHDGDEGLISTGFHTNDNVNATAGAYDVKLADWKSTITNDATVLYDETAREAVPGSGTQGQEGYVAPKPAVRNGGVQVVNQTGAELPSTGGIGTTIFYVAGTVLVVGAVVMLVAKRRMGSEA